MEDKKSPRLTGRFSQLFFSLTFKTFYCSSLLITNFLMKFADSLKQPVIRNMDEVGMLVENITKTCPRKVPSNVQDIPVELR